MTTMTSDIRPANPQEYATNPKLYKRPRPEKDPELGESPCEEEEEKKEVDDAVPSGLGKQARDRKSFNSRVEKLTTLNNEKRPNLLPEVTPELVRDHLKQQAAAAAKSSPHEDDTEADAICGIPYYLFMILAALLAAVLAGTILAVVYYDPNEELMPPDRSTASPSFSPPPVATVITTMAPSLNETENR